MTGPNAGDYRQKVTLQKPASPGAADTGGQRVTGWTTVGSYNAKVSGSAGIEISNALRLKQVETVMVEMRWNGLAILPSWQVLYGTRTFSIEAAINVEERNIIWLLTCKEVKNSI